MLHNEWNMHNQTLQNKKSQWNLCDCINFAKWFNIILNYQYIHIINFLNKFTLYLTYLVTYYKIVINIVIEIKNFKYYLLLVREIIKFHHHAVL